MAVIIREERIIEGKKVPGIKVFKTDRPLTRELREQAEELERFLSTKLKDVEKDLRRKKLLELKGKKKKVLKLWYEVGKALSFVMDTKIVPAEDRKYVWRALYDHAGEFAPGPINKRAQERPETSHFRYCYLVAQYPWIFVHSAGDWTAWVEFFDSIVIRNDRRIIKWLGSMVDNFATGSRQEWLRQLTKSVRRSFRGMDTSALKEIELHERLNKIFEETFTNEIS